MVRIIIKVITTIALMPVMIISTIAAWICMFCSWVASWIFHALAMILFLTALGSAGFGLEPKEEIWKMIITPFVLFIIPHVVEGIAAGLLIIKYRVYTWIFR